MSIRSTIALSRMSLLFFLAESPFVSLLAGVYYAHVVAIVLAGALIVAAPPGIVVTRALRARSEDNLAEKYRMSERFYLLAAAASQVGVLLAGLGRGALGNLGFVVSAGGMLAALRLILKFSTA